MDNLMKKITYIFKKGPAENGDLLNSEHKPSIIGNWRIVQYCVAQSEEEKPRWREVWSFAAMDEAETNGIYVCDYINLHSIIGKWEIYDNHIRLIRQEQACEYIIEELSAEVLRLKSTDVNEYISTIVFERAE
jgi:hypothetical protein